jgi:ribosomal protein L37AE/L43A
VEKLTKKDIAKISRRLIKHHTEDNSDILQTFAISESEIIKGVQCPKCSLIPMNRVHGKWCCQSCTNTSKDAHIAALKDYQLLLGSTVSNQELRYFLHLPSAKAAHTILNSMNLNYSGSKKARKYHLATDED